MFCGSIYKAAFGLGQILLHQQGIPTWGLYKTPHILQITYLFMYLVLGIKLRTLHLPGRHYAAELYIPGHVLPNLYSGWEDYWEPVWTSETAHFMAFSFVTQLHGVSPHVHRSIFSWKSEGVLCSTDVQMAWLPLFFFPLKGLQSCIANVQSLNTIISYISNFLVVYGTNGILTEKQTTFTVLCWHLLVLQLWNGDNTLRWLGEGHTKNLWKVMLQERKNLTFGENS